jgi:hypothetical protein
VKIPEGMKRQTHDIFALDTSNGNKAMERAKSILGDKEAGIFSACSLT